MPPAYLPPLSFDTPVIASTARQDKIEIAVQHGIIFETAGEVGNFLHYLGPPPAHSVGVGGSVYGRIFTNQQSQGPPFRWQTIRKRPTQTQPYPAPLFGGDLRVQPVLGTDQAWRMWSVLWLNPTRFLRHQQLPSPRSLLQESPHFTYDIYKGNVTPDDTDEFAYVEQDNWLSGRRFWSMYTSPRFWPRHLEYYLRKCRREIRDDLNRAATQTYVQILRESGNPISLYSVEHYWEFLSNESIETVKALKPLLDTYSAAHVDADPLPVQVSPGVEENSFCLRLKSRRGELLKIYAKTNWRIRIEVKHSLNGETPFSLPLGMGHTAQSMQGLLPLLAHLAEVSAVRVNHVLNHFRLYASAPNGQRTVLALIADIQSACNDHFKASEILRLLISNGSLVVGTGIPIGPLLRNELRRLVRRRILKTSNRRYSLMPEYKQALLYLQERGIGRLLKTRVRRRIQG